MHEEYIVPVLCTVLRTILEIPYEKYRIHPIIIYFLYIQIFISVCLLLLSWIPAIVTCENDVVTRRRHITELIFLPQIFINASPLSLFFIPFGFLPIIHIPILIFFIIVIVSYSKILYFFCVIV